MNGERRKKVDDIITTLKQIKSSITIVLNEESDECDALPEKLYGSPQNEILEDNMDLMENAMESIDDAIDQLQMIK